MSHTIDNLKPCSEHSFEIYPSTKDCELGTEPIQFKTRNPIELNLETNKVDISWSAVECSTGYRIHQKLEHSGTETEWTSDNEKELAVSLESPEPCVTYR